jgi:ferredoxin
MLIASNDRKVTNKVSPNGKTSKIANAFGLPAGKAYSCPGATSFCERICYAGKLEKVYKNVKAVLVRNYQELLYADYLDGVAGMANEIRLMITLFRAECEHKNAEKLFRIHWDGDFFSERYAQAWAIVVKENPDIRFWVYTRSFTDEINVLPYIAWIENLTVYLSADPVNIELANDRAEKYGVRIATVADTFDDARQTIIDSGRKTYACPENRKSIPIISEKGSACVRCGICIDGRGDVLFSRTKK